MNIQRWEGLEGWIIHISVSLSATCNRSTKVSGQSLFWINLSPLGTALVNNPFVSMSRPFSSSTPKNRPWNTSKLKVFPNKLGKGNTFETPTGRTSTDLPPWTTSTAALEMGPVQRCCSILRACTLPNSVSADNYASLLVGFTICNNTILFIANSSCVEKPSMPIRHSWLGLLKTWF